MGFRNVNVIWRSDIDANTLCIICQRHNAGGRLEKTAGIVMRCAEDSDSKCVMGEWENEEEYEADLHTLSKELKHAKLDAPSVGP